MGRPVTAHKKRLTEEEADMVREDYVQKMRASYPLIIRTLMHDLIVSIDKNGDIVFLNDAAVEFWGKQSEELVGTHFSDYLTPEERGRSQRSLQETIKSKGQVKGFIVKVESPMGVRTVAWNAVAIFDDEGNYMGAQATGKDLTDFLRTEEELKQSRSHFQQLFEVMVDPVVIVDLTGNILELSQSAEEILGPSREALIGKSFLETNVATPESKTIMTKNLERFKQGKPIPPHTIEAVTKDGQKLLYEVNPARIMYRGQPAILGIFRNITGQKMAEEKLQASEERFNYFMYNAPEAIWVQDVVGTFIDGNKMAEELTGYKKEELVGKNLLELLVQPDSIPKIMEDFKATMFGELSGPIELEMVRKDGSLVTVEATTIPVKRDGNVEIIGVTRDVTERKKTESALKESEEKFRTIFDGSTDGIVAADPKTHKFVFANARIYELTGYSVDELPQLGVADIVPPEDLNYALDQFQKQFEGKVSITRNMAILRKDKTVVYCDISSKFMEIGNSQYLIGFFRDVTERKEFEDILKENEEKFRTIFEGASDGIAAIDPTTMKVVFANPALVKILGFPMDKVIGSTLLDYIPKEEIAATMEKFQNGVSGKRDVFRDLTVLRQDNTRIYVDVTSKFLTFGNHRYLISFVRDVTEQKRAHEALLESEKKYREMINAMNDTVWVVDFDGKFVDVNDAAVKVSGYSRDELLSMGLTDIDNALTPEQIKGIIKGMKTDRTQVFETEHTTKDGRTFPVEISSNRVTYQGKPAILGIARDITERKKAEKELIRFSTAVKMSNDSIILTELDGTIVDVNYAGLRMYDADDKKDLIGKNSFDLLSSEKQKEALADTKKLMEQGYLPPREYNTVTKDGRKIVSESSTAVMKDATGKPIGFVTISRDITEKKKAAVALRESEKKYKEMIDGMNDAALVLDLDTNIIDVNQAAVDVLGYSREELLSMNVQNIDTSLTAETIKGLAKKMETNGLLVFETTHITKDGRTFPVEISSSRVTYQGKPAILSIERDITERKKAEEALRSSEESARRLLEFQNKIIDTATVWVNLIDLKGNVILWNRAAELVSGYSRKEIIGHNSMWSLLYPDPDYRAKIFSIGKEITEGKRIEDFYSTIKCKDGTLKTISWYSTSVRDEKGEPAGSISIGIDVTEREKAQQAKNTALALLKQSNKELESYTYVVSHDLKAPLRTIRSFGSFILEDYGDKLDETGQDYLNRMITASSHLDHMIEDLLVLSRVGRKFTEIKKVDLNKLLEEILSDLEATINEHKTKVVVAKLPVLSAQKVWMRQLFMNFISNALKFNESKSPKIEVLYEERDNDHLFKIRDNGIGIEEKYQERIFNLFERAPTEKKYEGTGAGLAICKKIVEHLGGKIWVESAPGKGSTFMFTLPKETKGVKGRKNELQK